MHLVPKEVPSSQILPWLGADIFSPQLDKLVTSQLGLLAQRRLARGVRLNHAEATVCLAWQTIISFTYLTVWNTRL